MERQIRFLTEARRAFEHRQRLVQLPLAEEWLANTSIGLHQADGMLDRLGNVQALLPDGNPLGKYPHLRKTKRHIGTRVHGGQDGLTKALEHCSPSSKARARRQASMA
jgi:hypothetical protein